MKEIEEIVKSVKNIEQAIKDFYKDGYDKFAKSQIKYQHIYKRKEKNETIKIKHSFLKSLKRNLTDSEKEELEFAEWFVKEFNL